ncbi:hypothetical protein I6G82_10845 [Lysinibacillus macroides]|uniref:Peptidase M10 metallopeptidase domain-containing protein n=1 Tax=Lysinibacillus macroides TaxID=33935 RepID=A0A0N0CWK6_9BACI|nr:hypothetical protein [Lysinibacillus macroides]KOY83117.1 hypothetical protein ADM90_07415 [Lysinibacillus macroides]QPR70025.1 hypothetical protein I6G82_10845 [Lysinibacillus macroides]
MVKRNFFSAFILGCLIIGYCSSTFASHDTAHILKGQFRQGASSLTYWLDSSVNSYGMQSHFQHAFTNWNNSSSKVNMSASTNASSDIKVYVGSNNLPVGYAGLTEMYYLNIFGTAVLISPNNVINGTLFDRVTIRIDDTQRIALGYTGWDKVVKLTGHEIGHALSMHHFENNPAHSNQNSWMYSGSQTNSAYPSSDDVSHLRYKWGN